MAATTWTTLRQRALRELGLGLLVPNSAISAFASTPSVTIPTLFQNTNWQSARLSSQGAVVFRPGSATSADNIRYAGAVTNSSGLITLQGATYADTTLGSEAVEIWWDEVRPDLEVLDAANRALEFVNYQTMLPLSHMGDNDGDMASSATTSWTALQSSTLSKVTTAAKTPYGLRSLRAVNSSPSGGAQSVSIPINQNRPFTAFAIGSASVGSCGMILLDATNSVAIGNTISSAELAPQLLQHPWDSSPSNCKAIAFQLFGLSASADLAWNGVWLYKLDALRINLPSYVSEAFKVPTIMQSKPRYVSQTAYVYPAESLEFTKLEEGNDYELLFHQADANPYAVQFNKKDYYDWPLWVEASIPYAQQGTFAAEGDTTNCPVHLFMPRFKMELLSSIYMPKFPDDKTYISQYNAAKAEWMAASAARPVRTVAKGRPTWQGVPR